MGFESSQPRLLPAISTLTELTFEGATLESEAHFNRIKFRNGAVSPAERQPFSLATTGLFAVDIGEVACVAARLNSGESDGSLSDEASQQVARLGTPVGGLRDRQGTPPPPGLSPGISRRKLLLI